ncbi:TIGR02281 family clan AA aspartic protease [Aurantimonas sp. A2-1-M11]|uniref:retropepsin-like aspartic protease family protein n=1 Tax=Aurantimonas sp. A2-1-M11 TaxID=3113712 RepID=UPI002F92631C
MQNVLIILAVTSMVALTIPSAFERYRASLLSGQVETVDPAPAIMDAAIEPRASGLSGRVARLSADAGGHFRTAARMNGRSVPVLVDTGATFVSIDETTARRLGVAPQLDAYRHRVQTANGETRAALVTVARLQLGPIELRDVDTLVTRDGTLPVALLGMSFLGRLDGVEIDAGRLTLRQ